MQQQKKQTSFLGRFFQRYFIDAMSAMALGLFSSLIIGLILSQLGKLPYLGFLAPFAEVVGASSPVVGSAIGAAIAWGLGAKPLVIFSCVVTGAFGYSVGGPVGAYISAVIGAEIGGLVSGKTKVDIVVSPLVTIVAGGFAGQLAGPFVQSLMQGLGNVINHATEMTPFPMGILVSVIVGMALTAPISSAALCIMLDLSGLAAGAATVGCCAQMVGFAVASFRDNRWGGLISQGVGTSMLQFGNILRRPQIWIAPTLASAVLGPVSTCIFKMTNTATGAGMGTSGLVGQFGTFAAMSGELPPALLMGEILLLHFILPALLTLGFDWVLRRIGWVRAGDMKLQSLS
ncbi:PTS sugar transporter subunit IIC [Clostridiaceae bacterium NSJ-31]|uniref:PTS sugar transporter subunit IIC n=1 Tax=Ligaoa zhengdingensis TaxID=2763658 RepID=A0A926E145_9FIRM|nr:PTS sugar transporter subunit IIC [Ligaoa zhengdingensis]MBC8546885.1 PTS sugar transporter subunit IIC [Ligaoa zhengdingensis]